MIAKLTRWLTARKEERRKSQKSLNRNIEYAANFIVLDLEREAESILLGGQRKYMPRAHTIARILKRKLANLDYVRSADGMPSMTQEEKRKWLWDFSL